MKLVMYFLLLFILVSCNYEAYESMAEPGFGGSAGEAFNSLQPIEEEVIPANETYSLLDVSQMTEDVVDEMAFCIKERSRSRVKLGQPDGVSIDAYQINSYRTYYETTNGCTVIKDKNNESPNRNYWVLADNDSRGQLSTSSVVAEEDIACERKHLRENGKEYAALMKRCREEYAEHANKLYKSTSYRTVRPFGLRIPKPLGLWFSPPVFF